MGEREGLKGSAPERRRRRVPRFLRHGIAVFILILVVEYFVIPELVLARQSLHALEHLNVLLLLAGLALEVVCQIGYAKLTLSLLPEGALSFSKAFRINLSALGVSHILPGGTAGGTGVGYRLMTTNGVMPTDVGFQAATQGLGSAVLLNAMLWLALVISIPLNGFRPVYVSVAIVTAILLAGFGALIYALTRGEGLAARTLRRIARRIPFLPEEKMEQVVRQLAGRLRAVARNRRLVVRGVSWAAVNWLADACCLWVCLAAFHYYVNPINLFVAYGVGNVLAAIPITPGGLGPVEAAVPLVLRGFGVPGGIGTLAVLGWRLYSFWLPIPVGAACYVSLKVQRGASFKERRAALEGLTRGDGDAGEPDAPLEDGGGARPDEDLAGGHGGPAPAKSEPATGETGAPEPEARYGRIGELEETGRTVGPLARAARTWAFVLSWRRRLSRPHRAAQRT